MMAEKVIEAHQDFDPHLPLRIKHLRAAVKKADDFVEFVLLNELIRILSEKYPNEKSFQQMLNHLRPLIMQSSSRQPFTGIRKAHSIIVPGISRT